MTSILRRLLSLSLIAIALSACVLPASALNEDGDLSLSITLDKPNASTGEEIRVEVGLMNASADYKLISDFSFDLTYDARNMTYSGMETQLEGLGASAKDGRITVTFSSPSEAACAQSGAVYAFRFLAADSFSATSAQFSADNLSAALRNSFQSQSLRSSNIKYAFSANTVYPAVTLRLAPRSGNASLAEIVPMIDGNTVELTPPFSPDVYAYEVPMDYSSGRFSFFAVTPADPMARVDVNWPAELVVGDNRIEITVTGQDKTTKLTYYVTVKRLPEGESPNAQPSAEMLVTGSDAQKETKPPETTTTAAATGKQTEKTEKTEKAPAAEEVSAVPGQNDYLTYAIAVAAIAVVGALISITSVFTVSAKYKHKLAEAEKRMRTLGQQNAAMYYTIRKNAQSSQSGSSEK